MRIHLGCRDGAVPQHLLDGADISTIGEERRREGVP